MQKILIIGEEEKTQQLRKKLTHKNFDIAISDGDQEEDFKDFDILFDLNFDDDNENFPFYASLRDKLIFLSSVKQSLAESAYVYPEKVRSRIFGFNSIPFYFLQSPWEISAYRGNELPHAESFLKQINQTFMLLDDQVGMYRPRRDFLALNETALLCQQGYIPNYLQNEIVLKEFQQIDEIGITTIFETLMSIYENTKETKYVPCSLLKKKYLRNHKMIK